MNYNALCLIVVLLLYSSQMRNKTIKASFVRFVSSQLIKLWFLYTKLLFKWWWPNYLFLIRQCLLSKDCFAKISFLQFAYKYRNLSPYNECLDVSEIKNFFLCLSVITTHFTLHYLLWAFNWLSIFFIWNWNEDKIRWERYVLVCSAVVVSK